MSDFETHPIGTGARMEAMKAALQPFADFADRQQSLPENMVITQGSLADHRQLTMGHCYAAANSLTDPDR